MSFIFQSPKSPISYQTSIEQKLKAKNAAHAFMNHVKNNSPKLQNLIREKCKSRIKEARQKKFQHLRELQNEDKTIITQLLREEIAEFEKSIEIQDLMIKEMLEATEVWFIEELENQMKNWEEYVVEINDEIIAFCPICEKLRLVKDGNKLKCSCGISFKFDGLEESFVSQVQTILQNHEKVCETKLNFYIEPNVNKQEAGLLNCICTNCDFYRTI